MPDTIRPGGPTRQLALNEERTPIFNRQGLDIPGEIDWFVRSYQTELGLLATHLQRAGTVQWGLVQFCR